MEQVNIAVTLNASYKQKTRLHPWSRVIATTPWLEQASSMRSASLRQILQWMTGSGGNCAVFEERAVERWSEMAVGKILRSACGFMGSFSLC